LQTHRQNQVRNPSRLSPSRPSLDHRILIQPKSGSSDSGSTQSGSKIDIFPKDERTYSQQEQDRNQREAQKGYEAQQREEQNEIMRDKSHDRRLKTDDDTSIGVDATPEPNVNIRRTY
jgi:hypothetical protein